MNPPHAPWVAAVAALCVLPAVLRSQPAAPPPRSALAVGWSPAAGLFGAEFVRRPAAGGPLPLGYALGAGLVGPGARVHVGLGRGARDLAARRVPYAGVGITANTWARYLTVERVATLEGGVQFWPAARRRTYFDLGAGAAVVTRDGSAARVAPALRALVGVGF